MKGKPDKSQHVKYVFISLVILLAFSALAINALLHNLRTSETNTKDNWQVPALPEQFSWEEVESTSEFSKSVPIFVTYPIDTEKSENDSYNEIYLPGKLYTVSIGDTDPLYESAGRGLEKEIDRILKEASWVESLQYKNKSLLGTSADGVTGSSRGYVKMIGDEIRTIVFSYVYDGNWITGEPAVKLECPCETNMTIYISDPIDLTEYEVSN